MLGGLSLNHIFLKIIGWGRRMSQGNPIEERRRWQPCWLVKTVAIVILTGAILNGWATYASSEKDSKQDSRITAVETNQTVIIKNQEDQKEQMRQLIALSTQTNILVQTHIARNPD